MYGAAWTCRCCGPILGLEASILIGSASCTDKHLSDSRRFYGPEVKTPEERLRFCAARLPV